MFVPCAGPVLAAITVVGATQDVGARAIVLTLAYATGAAIPMLIVAFGGRAGMTALRPHAHRIRQVLGVVVALTALAIALNVDRHFQTALPGYTESLQKKVEQNGRAQSELQKLRGSTRVSSDTTLRDLGAAPELAGLSTLDQQQAADAPAAARKGRPRRLLDVLVHQLPADAPAREGLVPDLRRRTGSSSSACTRPSSRSSTCRRTSRGAVRRLGITYPVALDNDYKTWNAFQNQYWPAKYLIDRRGHLRYVHFGEGEYDTTEARIRTLLGENAGMLPVANELSDPTPKARTTPESYLGYNRLARFSDKTITPDRLATYHFPDRELQLNELSYAGRWRVNGEDIVAGPGARLRLRFTARNVHLVLGGRGSVRVLVDGRPVRTVRVNGSRLYTLLDMRRQQNGLLELRFTPGVRGYAFTFG